MKKLMLIFALFLVWGTQVFSQNLTAPELRGAWAGLGTYDDGRRPLIRFDGIGANSVSGDGVIMLVVEQNGNTIKIGEVIFSYNVIGGNLNLNYNTFILYDELGNVVRRVSQNSRTSQSYRVIEEGDKIALILQNEPFPFLKILN